MLENIHEFFHSRFDNTLCFVMLGNRILIDFVHTNAMDLSAQLVYVDLGLSTPSSSLLLLGLLYPALMPLLLIGLITFLSSLQQQRPIRMSDRRDQPHFSLFAATKRSMLEDNVIF